MVEKNPAVSGNLRSGVLVATAAGAHGNTSFEMLRVESHLFSKFIIIIVLNIETVENATQRGRRGICTYKAVLVL